MTEPPDERSLRDAAAAGDPFAWRTLFDASYDRVRAYIRWRTGGIADLADDCEQETWLVAVARLRRFDPARSHFAGWVLGIAANVVRAQVRWRKRHRPLTGNPAAPSLDPARDRAEAVAVALAALPARYEAALRAKYLDGRSVDEMAAADGATPKAVESLLTRAREAFRTAYTRADR